MKDLIGKAENVKLIISEVDGVITDGFIPYDALGNVPFKNFNTSAFKIIGEIRKDIDVVFVSSEPSISHNLLRQKNIPFFWAKGNKLDTIKHILQRYQVTPEEVIYLGSVYDKECMNMIPLSVNAMDIYHGSAFDYLYNWVLKAEISRRNACS